jgi:hypothetical protein
VILLTDGCSTPPQNIYIVGDLRTGTGSSMTQLIFGSALGFILGQSVLHGIKHSIGWLQRDELRKRVGKLPSVRGSDFLSGFIKYAGVLGAIAALITFGAWSVGDYLSAKSARPMTSANVLDAVTAASVADPHGSPKESARITPPPKANSAAAMPVDNADPYADSDFKVQRRPQHAATHLSLRETLVQRSEARARADLLRQTQEHVHRSRYDCEAAERATKYLEAGLDVWGFATWQFKYFPRDGYKGATLPQCKDIENVNDLPRLDLHSTVANGNR